MRPAVPGDTGADSGEVGTPAGPPGLAATPPSIGSYRLESLLGQGGMAAVYRCLDAGGEPVAVKWLHRPNAAVERRLPELTRVPTVLLWFLDSLAVTLFAFLICAQPPKLKSSPCSEYVLALL